MESFGHILMKFGAFFGERALRGFMRYKMAVGGYEHRVHILYWGIRRGGGYR